MNDLSEKRFGIRGPVEWGSVLLLVWLSVTLTSPVRTACAAERPEAPAQADEAHPLDAALKVAREGLEHILANVQDYTATVIKREQIKGKLSDHTFMELKIRHRQEKDGREVVPFSVYLRFLLPKSLEGREAIFVEGKNGGKIIAHDRGLKNFMRLNLDPQGFLAMMGNRYPITQIGLKRLIEQLIEKAEGDREKGDCDVRFYENAKVDGRVCRMIQVTHPTRDPRFEFYRAQIFVDRELNIPIRYAAWTWPEREGGEPVLLEEYTYRNVRLNVGLSDTDFDPDNPAYDYP